MLTTLLMATALAGPGEYLVTLQGGVGGGVGPPSVAGYGIGRLTFNLTRQFSIGAAGVEGVASTDGRILGSIGFYARYRHPIGFYVRGGFEHHHEAPFDVFVDRPFGVLLGSAPLIRHRSGGEIAVGWEYTLPPEILKHRLGVYGDLSVSAFPDSQGPPVYVMADVGWLVNIGPRRPPREDR